MPILNPSTHKPDTLQAPVLAKTFSSTEIGSAIDLRAQVGYPPYAPQRLILINSDPTAAASAVLKDAAGNSFTVPVPAATAIPVDSVVLTIEATTTDLSTFNIVAQWWDDGSHGKNSA
jgi:hypothetical protein